MSKNGDKKGYMELYERICCSLLLLIWYTWYSLACSYRLVTLFKLCNLVFLEYSAGLSLFADLKWFEYKKGMIMWK